MRLGVIIPAYNEADLVLSCLESVFCAAKEANMLSIVGEDSKESRIVVVLSDGGSKDASVSTAKKTGAIVVETKKGDARGRGPTLHRGLKGVPNDVDVLLFLHVDCTVPRSFFIQLQEYWEKKKPSIGYCKIRFDRVGLALRFFEWSGSFETVFSTFGDQGIVVSKKLYDSLGGFPDMVLMEDVEFLRTARRVTKIHALPMTLSVSARKFETRGPLTYMAQCVVILCLYLFLGWSPARCAKLYSNPFFLAPGKTFALSCVFVLSVGVLSIRYFASASALASTAT